MGNKCDRHNYFDSLACENLAWWVENDKKQALKIIKLIKEVERDPFQGIGKPEKLKHDLSGCLSRRINCKHPLVDRVLADRIRILACRYHN